MVAYTVSIVCHDSIRLVLPHPLVVPFALIPVVYLQIKLVITIPFYYSFSFVPGFGLGRVSCGEEGRGWNVPHKIDWATEGLGIILLVRSTLTNSDNLVPLRDLIKRKEKRKKWKFLSGHECLTIIPNLFQMWPRPGCSDCPLSYRSYSPTRQSCRQGL